MLAVIFLFYFSGVIYLWWDVNSRLQNYFETLGSEKTKGLKEFTVEVSAVYATKYAWRSWLHYRRVRSALLLLGILLVEFYLIYRFGHLLLDYLDGSNALNIMIVGYLTIITSLYVAFAAAPLSSVIKKDGEK